MLAPETMKQDYLFIRAFGDYLAGAVVELAKEMAEAIEQYAPGTLKLAPMPAPEPAPDATDGTSTRSVDGPPMNAMVSAPTRRRNAASAAQAAVAPDSSSSDSANA